ncbi:hypothetical protein F5883DRAFT_183798 [Diaporthe sp. PMI_573]|nr:hypothetical protein F5883DRAFT_183798 [Diaporthaceae sp. PMI_573]
MPRLNNRDRSVYAEPSRSEKITVYRDADCRAIFSDYNNAQLRQRKPIASLVHRRNLWVPGFSTDRLITVLRSLQKDNIFDSSYSAQRAFPELFQLRKPDCPIPVSTPLPTPIQVESNMVTSGQPQEDLYRSLETLYSTEIYSDLTISSTAKEYRVHRAIVCPRSAFLAAACRHSFKEACDGVISLPDDEPSVVDIMIQYFYRLDYRHPIDIDRLPQLSEDQASKCLHSPPTESQDNDIRSSDLLLHAKVYALAEKYAVNGLKGLALAKFKTLASLCWATSDFLDAVSETYNSTIDTDRGLRDVVLEVISAHHELLGRDETKKLLQRERLLAYDLIMHYHQNGQLR